MFERIIAYSLENKLIVMLGVCALMLGGIYSMVHVSVDAVPDITNNQVQVVTTSPTLAAEEIEKFITLPVEMAVSNIPKVTEVRSISRYGLSVITIVFEDDVNIMTARQFVNERLTIVNNELPAGLGTPELMPITTGLGEVYQYILQVKPGYESKYDIMQLRTIQDWIVKRQLAGTPGIIEVSSFGGLVKEYEVSVSPEKLLAYQLTISDVATALERNNQNSGGSYIESGDHAFYIRTEGRVEDMSGIGEIWVRNTGIPIRIQDVATVRMGSPKRYGAMTMDGRGEVVGGITLMLKGANAYEVVKRVKERMEFVQAALPEGVEIYPYLDRAVLVNKTLDTVAQNLIEGGLIVIFILVLFLGNFRAGLIVSSVIPLSMLFAFVMMDGFNVSANLMSLGAIDFGIVVDGAVIIVEGVLHSLYTKHRGKRLSSDEMNTEILHSTSQIYRSAAFGVLIILVVFIPVFALEGIEGKTFLPMAQTVSFAILGSLFLSLTYVPVASALFLKKDISEKVTLSEKLVNTLQKRYQTVLIQVLHHPKKVIMVAILLFISAIGVFRSMGSEFIPTLEEGDLAMQMSVPPGSSLEKSIRASSDAEAVLKLHFPEVIHVVSKIGTAEVPTDPMAIEDADIMILLKEKEEWVSADNREALIAKMKEKLSVVADAKFEFSQPIQLRFNELMTGAKTDIAIQIFGEDPTQLKRLADGFALRIRNVEGVGDVKVEQTQGLRQLSIVMDSRKIALYGVQVEDVNTCIRSAYAGAITGVVYENERYFNLVVRLDSNHIRRLSLGSIFVRNSAGVMVPLSEVVRLEERSAPMQISREDAKRRITIGVNVRDRDIATLVEELKIVLDGNSLLPAGYTLKFGGQFENLEHALQRLQLLVPVAFILILFILYLAFGSLQETLIIFMTVPLSSIGGVLALWLRDMPFSISAGIGFIALFGVAVLNGIVLVNEFVKYRQEKSKSDLMNYIVSTSGTRLRPVLMTALVASLGFLPMAFATSNGAEVQRPLATVVIGGLVTSTLLTLFVLPAIYYWLERRKGLRGLQVALLFVCLFFMGQSSYAQAEKTLSLEQLITGAQLHHISLQQNAIEIQKKEQEAQNVYRIAPLQWNFQYGQIDGEFWDTQWSVSQDFGAPWTLKRKRDAAKMGIDFARQEQYSLQREVKYQVTSLYYQWMYHAQAYQLLQGIVGNLQGAEVELSKRQESGDLSFAELLSFQQLNTSLKQRMQQYYSGQNKQKQELLFVSGLDGEINTTLFNALPFSDSGQVHSSFYAKDITKISQQTQQSKVIASRYHPSVQVGYFRQSLNHIQGFQGLTAGVSIPLFWGGKRLDVTFNNLQIASANKAYRNEVLYWEKELMTLQQDLFFMKKNVSRSGNGLKAVETGLLQIQEQLKSGYISHYDFIRMADIIIIGALSEMQMIHDFNQAVIKYQFLTEE